MRIPESELILNADGSIYHLNLLPEDLASTIITVGDPERVAHVSRYFDCIELNKGKREFVAHTGLLAGKRITVISTGIGTDNIDIVLNELDALVNINLKTRETKEKLTSLRIIRIGTSGAIQPEIGVDSFLVSELAIGFDNLLHFYQSKPIQDEALQNAFIKHTNWYKNKSVPYVVKGNAELIKMLSSDGTIPGFTATNVGFYGPQGRQLRISPQDIELNDKLASFNYFGRKITNLEMETSGIYGLSNLLGHKAVSLNCILANRPKGVFSKNPSKSVDSLIRYTLEKLVS